MGNTKISPYGFFEPISGWTQSTDDLFKNTPSVPRHDFVGDTKFSQTHPQGGFQYLKADDIFVDADANIVFSTNHLNTVFPPTAFYIVCKRLIFRPRPNIPTFTFNYFLPPPPKPSTPPKRHTQSGNRGQDGTDGTPGYPPESKGGQLGIMVCFAFNEIMIQNDPEPNRDLVHIVATGYDGQEGGDGGEGGDCFDGPCTSGGGIGGLGGDGGAGIGGGNVSMYGPQSQIDVFYRRVSANVTGKPGGGGGKNGQHGFGVILPPKRPGTQGVSGVDGTVVHIAKNDVLQLFR